MQSVEFGFSYIYFLGIGVGEPVGRQVNPIQIYNKSFEPHHTWGIYNVTYNSYLTRILLKENGDGNHMLRFYYSFNSW